MLLASGTNKKTIYNCNRLFDAATAFNFHVWRLISSAPDCSNPASSTMILMLCRIIVYRYVILQISVVKQKIQILKDVGAFNLLQNILLKAKCEKAEFYRNMFLPQDGHVW